MATATLSMSAIDITSCGLLIRGQPTLTQWLEIGESIGRITKGAIWLIGDWYCGIDAWGRKYDDCEERFGVKYSTATNAVRVSRSFEFSRRRENLTWSHHSEVCCLDVGEQEKWLDLSTKYKWSSRELRTRVHETPACGELEDALDLSDVPIAEPHAILSRAMQEAQKVRDTFRDHLAKVQKKGVFTLASLTRTLGSTSSGQYQEARMFVRMAEIHPSVEVIRTFGKKGLQQFQFVSTGCVDGHERIRSLAQRISDAAVSDAGIRADAEDILTLLGG